MKFSGVDGLVFGG